MAKKVEPLDAIKSVMMLGDEALSPVQISNLIQKNLHIQVTSSAVESTMQSHTSLFTKIGGKWKLNTGVD